MKQKNPRLKKNPNAAAYVVEVIDRSIEGREELTNSYHKFYGTAIETAKDHVTADVQARVFKASYKLVKVIK